MSFITLVDAEDLVKEWLLSTSVASLVNNKIFLAMPVGFADPKLSRPVVTLSRVGGAPLSGSDVPVDIARISFRVWAPTRPAAKGIATALVGEVESLSLTGGYVSSIGRLESGETVTWLWAPEPVSDISRYIVDVRFTTLSL